MAEQFARGAVEARKTGALAAIDGEKPGFLAFSSICGSGLCARGEALAAQGRW